MNSPGDCCVLSALVSLGNNSEPILENSYILGTNTRQVAVGVCGDMSVSKVCKDRRVITRTHFKRLLMEPCLLSPGELVTAGFPGLMASQPRPSSKFLVKCETLAQKPQSGQCS